MVLFLDEKRHYYLKDAVDQALEGTVGRHLISVLFTTHHKALVFSFKIKQTPTLIIFNSDVEEIARITNEDLLTVPFFRKALALLGDEAAV